MNILSRKSPVPAALALGSNSSDADRIFHAAIAKLEAQGFAVERLSAIIRTAPVDCTPGTPDFFNACLVGSWAGSAKELLKITQKIEVESGRPADHGFHAPRTLDLDIILLGKEVMQTEKLTIPHPRARNRRFVLEPLAEIAPDWRFPDTQESVQDALKALK